MYPTEYLTYGLGSNAEVVTAPDAVKTFKVTDHLGSTRAEIKERGPRQHWDYEPYGKAVAGVPPRKGFIDKEKDKESGLGDFGVRKYDDEIGRFTSPDPLWEEFRAWSPYSYSFNNPLLFVDPDGEAPVFSFDGRYIGTTEDGYTGDIIIYYGDIDFSEMSADELLAAEGAYTYDKVRSSLTGGAKSDIWTHIVSQLEGQPIYDLTFTMSDLQGGKIHFDGSHTANWISDWIPGSGKGKISGSDEHKYETTVENIQSSVIVHEWYSHIKKDNRTHIKSHRLAYKNVINYKALWDKTTDSYKGFNVTQLLKYTKSETGRTQVDPIYRNLYKKYAKYNP